MLLDLIRNHSVFPRKIGFNIYFLRKQAHVEHQLLVFLPIVVSSGSDVIVPKLGTQINWIDKLKALLFKCKYCSP